MTFDVALGIRCGLVTLALILGLALSPHVVGSTIHRVELNAPTVIWWAISWATVIIAWPWR